MALAAPHGGLLCCIAHTANLVTDLRASVPHVGCVVARKATHHFSVRSVLPVHDGMGWDGTGCASSSCPTTHSQWTEQFIVSSIGHAAVHPTRRLPEARKTRGARTVSKATQWRTGCKSGIEKHEPGCCRALERRACLRSRTRASGPAERKSGVIRPGCISI